MEGKMWPSDHSLETSDLNNISCLLNRAASFLCVQSLHNRLSVQTQAADTQDQSVCWSLIHTLDGAQAAGARLRHSHIKLHFSQQHFWITAVEIQNNYGLHTNPRCISEIFVQMHPYRFFLKQYLICTASLSYFLQPMDEIQHY